MAQYAKITESLTVERYLEIDDPAVIPKHKHWSDGGLHIRPVVDPGRPEYRRELFRHETVVNVERDRVLVVHTITPKGLVDQCAAVKAECRRRILDRIPEWKQANITARSHELDRIQSGFMRDADGTRLPARDLTASEMAEEVAIGQAWAWIRAVRAASDQIEALDPIPNDFDANERWPS